MNFSALIHTIQQTHTALQQQAVKAINRSLTIRNWLIGYYIVEFEQNGDDRAKYGERLVDEIAKKVKVKGLSGRSLKLFRQFYLAYPQIVQTVSAQLQSIDYKRGKSQTASDELLLPESSSIFGALSQKLENNEVQLPPEKILDNLSFSHLTELIKIDDPLKRTYYELLTIKGSLSVRELKRQINTLSYERTGLSKDKEVNFQKVLAQTTPQQPAEAVKDIYVFEFLELPNLSAIEEKDIETALLNHLQQFILELGHGFCFEARQQKIRIGDEYFFIDLVVYHRILKCHVLIELKIEAFKHANAVQLNN
jgi:predicted nuclease of restriction endonuclease-like (RecB) superfamily